MAKPVATRGVWGVWVLVSCSLFTASGTNSNPAHTQLAVLLAATRNDTHILMKVDILINIFISDLCPIYIMMPSRKRNEQTRSVLFKSAVHDWLPCVAGDWLVQLFTFDLWARARAHTHIYFSLCLLDTQTINLSLTQTLTCTFSHSPTYKHTELRFVLRFRVSNCVLDSLAVTRGDTLKSVDHFCLAD